MHNAQMRTRAVSKKWYQNELAKARLGDNIANHMAYIYALVLYDKMGLSFKKITNYYNKVVDLRTKLQDDSNEDVTSESLMKYCEKKKIDGYGLVKRIPMSQKLFLTDMKGKGAIGMDKNIDSALLSTIFLSAPVLKESFRFTVKQMNEFLDWIEYGIRMYNTKLPKESGYVWDDDYIHQIFIEDEHWDIRKGEKVSECTKS